MSAPRRFRVASSHIEDLASGASFEPGATCVGVDEKDPHDKRLIDEGRLVLLGGEPTAKSKSNDTQEASK